MSLRESIHAGSVRQPDSDELTVNLASDSAEHSLDRNRQVVQQPLAVACVGGAMHGGPCCGVASVAGRSPANPASSPGV